MADQRTGTRFPLNLPITVKGDDKSAAVGKTANVSAGGVYIEADVGFELGSVIEFAMLLPGDALGTEKDVEVNCRGRVVRMEDAERSGSGFGCVIEQYRFVRP